jgi:UDP-glucose 4-epimerase
VDHGRKTFGSLWRWFSEQGFYLHRRHCGGDHISPKALGYEIINLGNNQPHKLSDVIRLIEKFTGKTARVENREFHKADPTGNLGRHNKGKRAFGLATKGFFGRRHQANR